MTVDEEVETLSPFFDLAANYLRILIDNPDYIDRMKDLAKQRMRTLGAEYQGQLLSKSHDAALDDAGEEISDAIVYLARCLHSVAVKPLETCG